MSSPSTTPAIWLIALIMALPQLCETIYSPALPIITHAFSTTASMAEHTLSIYLFGLAIGILFWGKASDKLGRKPCIIYGLLVFIAGCIGCYFSRSIAMLMVTRFVQAFGASIGSVLGHAICRDVFQGPALGKVYSTIAIALALFLALAPLCGALITETFGWAHVFVFLCAYALILAVLVFLKLPETLQTRQSTSIWDIAKVLARDRTVIGAGMIVGGSCGMFFSYLAEGPFYLIKELHLSPSIYGLSFLAIAPSTMCGGFLSRQLCNSHSAKEIITYGLIITMMSMVVFSSVAAINHYLYQLPHYIMICVTIICQMIAGFGRSMALSNVLALALANYRDALGTASSILGCYYFCLTSLAIFIMGLIHTGSLLPMPIYFLSLSCLMIVVNRVLIK